MSPAASNANATGTKKGFLSGLTSGGGAGRTVFIAATALGVMAVGVTGVILGNAAETATYYVLSRDVAARTPITQDMMKPVITSAEGVPKSFDMEYLSSHEVFSKFALKADNVVTTSNTGALEAINKDLPAGFVVASFSAAAENAVAGKLRTRDYVDVYAIDAEGKGGGGASSKMVLHHMLVLDVTVSPSTITQASGDAQAGKNLSPGPESAAARGGIPSLYTVAVTPQDAAKISLIRDKSLFLTLAANDVPLTLAPMKLSDVFNQEPVGDSGAGTADMVKASIDGTAAVVTPVPTATP